MSNEFDFQDHSNYKYFSMIPHIITEIGLKASEIGVYVAIKRSAGENSTCTRSKGSLAKQAGVSQKTLFTIIQKLCEVNKILKKPLIKCTARLTECGDKDTNLIEVVDIWPEAINLISEGQVKFTPPQVKFTRGVRSNLPEGQVKFTHKEEPFKKNPSKKTTTPTPFNPEVVEVVSLDAFMKDAKELKSKIEKEALKPRRKTISKGHWEENVKLGPEWVFSVEYYAQKIKEYGLQYVKDQINYMLKKQIAFFSGKCKEGINMPQAFFKSACEKNYAESTKKIGK